MTAETARGGSTTTGTKRSARVSIGLASLPELRRNEARKAKVAQPIVMMSAQVTVLPVPSEAPPRARLQLQARGQCCRADLWQVERCQ